MSDDSKCNIGWESFAARQCQDRWKLKLSLRRSIQARAQARRKHIWRMARQGCVTQAEQLGMPDSGSFSLQVATLHHSLPALDFGLLWRRVQEWGGYQQVR